MQKSSLPVGIKTLYKYYTESKTLDLDCPIQRASGQWNNLAASMLIHSILSDYIIPNLYFRKETKDGANYLSVLDGKQRLTTVFSFINDEWVTHAKVPKVMLDGVEYDISLKKFSELDDDIKSAIMGYRFTTYQLESCTDEEIEETFARLNAGTPLSKIQQARPKMGMKIAEWCNKLVATDFFQKSLNLTLAQLRREDDFLMLITGMMLIDSYYEDGFKIKTSASAAECVRFAEYIRNNYAESKKETIELLVEYLNEAFDDSEYKFLRKNNIPIVMYVAFIAFNKGVSTEEYKSCVVDFFEGDCTEAYNEASGSGNVKLININTRISELLKFLMTKYPSYFEEDDEIPASFIERVEKNSEVNQEESTSEEVPADTSKNFVLFHLGVKNISQEEDTVYEVDSTDEDYLNKLGSRLAKENAQLFGVSFENDEEEPYSYSWEILEDMTEEEIKSKYGEIISVVPEEV